jgi:lipoate-protein ligase A
MRQEYPLKLVRYDLDGLDPYRNLAVEEHLARTCPEDVVRLVFYRNAPTVVIGRNQDPWQEADLAAAARRGVAVARRVTGGGAVVHDTGNLNYGFIMPRRLYLPARFLQIVVEALGTLGIAATACARSSIWVGDRKVSGTAFLLTGRTALLHGCILVHSDLEGVRRLLAPPSADRHSRAVASIRSPVTRLCEVSPAATLDAVREAIAAGAGLSLAGAAGQELQPAELAPAALEPLLARQQSWEWIYGRTADFEHVLHLAAGPVTLRVKRAEIAEVQAEGRPALQAALQARWVGCRYDGAGLAAALLAPTGLALDEAAELAASLRREIPPTSSPSAHSPCPSSFPGGPSRPPAA